MTSRFWCGRGRISRCWLRIRIRERRLSFTLVLASVAARALPSPMVLTPTPAVRLNFTMFSRMFGKPKEEVSTISTLEKLNETLEMLEKKEKVLQKKIALEIEKAKEFTRLKNKRAAIQCLKRKKLYEVQVEQLGNFQLRIHDQMIMLEGAKATTETVEALRSGALAMKAIHKATNIDDVDKTVDEINEQNEILKALQEALANPMGTAADIDEDELEAELEDLEGAELKEDLIRPSTHQLPPAAEKYRPTAAPAAKKPVENTEEEDELAALQAEMAF